MTAAGYWEARWREGRIGFHEGKVNAALQRAWPGLRLPAGSAVFVPLCGKAHDLAWLAERGHRVVGAELSAIAVADFFREQGLEPVRRRIGAIECWSDQRLALLCGDFFALDAELLAGAAGGGACAGWWDRAALIALPPERRPAYVAHLAALLPAGARGLLLTYELPQPPESGPPYTVTEAEVRRLFAPPSWRPAELIERTDVTADLRARGLECTSAHEALYALARV